MSLIIRPACPHEAAELTAIAHEAKRHWGYPDAWLIAWREALTIRPRDVAAHTVLVAEREGELLGFVVLVDGGSHWRLDHLWVRPAFHGEGTGRALLRAALDVAGTRRPGLVRIEADPFAVGFYERCGARRVGTVPAPVLGAPRELPLLEIGVPHAD